MARPYSKDHGFINYFIRNDNTSGISGVSYHKKSNTWSAILEYDKNIKRKYLKTFEEAVRQRLIFEIEMFGIDKAPQKDLFSEYLTKEDLIKHKINQ